MKWILILVIIAVGPGNVHSQELTDEMISSMVELVDEYIELTEDQEQAFLDILRTSYQEVQKIQHGKEADVVKLNRMTIVQEQADQQLKGLLSAEQYAAYQVLLSGGEQSAESMSYADRVQVLAEDMQLDGETAEKFNTCLIELDAATQGIAARAAGESDVARDLLTEILATDIELIRLLGRDKYVEFFKFRENGALSDFKPEQTGSVEQVLVFADLVQKLELSSSQTREVIRLMLENEERLLAIRGQYLDRPSLMQEKLRLEEQKGLIRLQEFLSEEQVEVLLQLLGQ